MSNPNQKLSLTGIILALFAAASSAARADATDVKARDEAQAQRADALKQLDTAQKENADLRAALAGDEDKLAKMPNLGDPLTDDQMTQIQQFIDSLHATDPQAVGADAGTAHDNVVTDMPVIAAPAPVSDTAAARATE